MRRLPVMVAVLVVGSIVAGARAAGRYAIDPVKSEVAVHVGKVAGVVAVKDALEITFTIVARRS